MTKTDAEKQFELTSYTSTFDDFNEMIIQWGYTVLFVVVFPLAPLLSLLNNFVEVRVDSKKLLSFTQRPTPRQVSDIGAWQSVFTAITAIGIVTNVAIVMFEMDFFEDHSDAWRLKIFLLFEHFMFLFLVLLAFVLPDVPNSVLMHAKRQRYIKKCLITGAGDIEADDDDERNDLNAMMQFAFGDYGDVADLTDEGGESSQQDSVVGDSSIIDRTDAIHSLPGAIDE